MGYPTHPYGSYHSLAQMGGMGGAMMTSQMAMMGQQQSGMMGVQQNCGMGQQNGLMGAQGVIAQPSGVAASPYMSGMTQGIMGQQQSGLMVQQQNGIMGQQQSGMIGHQQVGGLATLPHQQVYGVQQTQWNAAQVRVCLLWSMYVLSVVNELLVTKRFLCLSDDSAHGRHECLQQQQRDGIRQPAHGWFSKSKFSTHDGPCLEMISYIQKRKTIISQKRESHWMRLSMKHFLMQGRRRRQVWRRFEKQLLPLFLTPLAVSSIVMHCKFPCLPSGNFGTSALTVGYRSHWLELHISPLY